MTDPISDMLTRIRNACRAALPEVAVPHSRLKESIAHVPETRRLRRPKSASRASRSRTIKIKLKYTGRKPVIEGLRRVSAPGLRRYTGSQEVPRVRGGLGVSILSTSEGVMTGTQAQKKNVGGELLCVIW